MNTRREDGSPEPDFEEQARQAFRNPNAILAEAGCTIDDVVEVTVFLWIRSSISNGPGRSCPSSGQAPHPALTGIGVTWLHGFHFEIKAIAKLPDGTRQTT